MALSLEAVSAEVDALHKIKETEYTADIKAKQAKIAELQEPLIAKLKALDTGDLSSADKARVAYLLARAYDACIEYSRDAEAQWSRAMKLEPTNSAVWLGLGQCVWKRADLRTAKECIENSLKHKQTAEGLRCLSQLLRQSQAAAGPASVPAVRESVEKAKAAVALAPSEAANWQTLGTAYLSLFIIDAECVDGLDKSAKALARAVSLEAAAVAAGTGHADPDLHYNRGEVLAFLEDYDAAVAEFNISGTIDPALPFKQAVHSTLECAAKKSDKVLRHAYLRPRRITELVSTLDNAAAVAAEAALVGERKPVTLAQLTPGVNAGVYIRLRHLMPLLNAERPPHSLVAADSTGACMCVSLFHLNSEALSRFNTDKDTLCVLDPVLKNITFTVPAGGVGAEAGSSSGGEGGSGASSASSSGSESRSVTYPCLQVFRPQLFLRNGKVEEARRQPNKLTLTAFDG